MKMTKKILMVAIAASAIALVGCKMGGGDKTFDKEEVQKPQGTKKDLTIGYKNNGNSKLYKRVWQQLGDKETVQALETLIAIDMTKVSGSATTNDVEKNEDGTNKTPLAATADAIWTPGSDGAYTKETRAVVGLIFDLHETKTKEFTEGGKKVTKKLYDFVLIGYRPATKSCYVEKYSNVPEDAFSAASNDSSFSDAAGIDVTYLPTTTGKSTSATKYYLTKDDGLDESKIGERNGVLGKGEEEKIRTKDTPVDLQEMTAYITQENPGTYHISFLGLEFDYTPEKTEDTPTKWYKNGYRIGGAGYYVNVPVDTEIYANFNSKNDNTVGLEEEVDE